MQAYHFSNPRRPNVLDKQEQAMGTVLGCLKEAKVPADPSLEANPKRDRSVSREAGASWQALLSTMDAKARKKAKVAQQNSIWKSFAKSIGLQGIDPEGKDEGDLENSSIYPTQQTTKQKVNQDNPTEAVSACRSQPPHRKQSLKDIGSLHGCRGGNPAQWESTASNPTGSGS
ncbi:hypothetical protein NDU88_003745 [Pleurodeles waltl]|uniref:Uncharacterized protein n=1 Tax=Pleurodeles waltl TaxID=8319 RepID=A0AAV7PFH3_PLEWA|nr:hypothetical protein NDU88_003745 [Pleurodeles waltl]